MGVEGGGEEPSSRPNVTPSRDEHVDDLPVLVDSAIHVAPAACDLHIGLIDEPAIPDCMSTRAGSLGEEGRESLHGEFKG